MKCEKCGIELKDKEVNTNQGKNVCEDCLFDILNPTKACDPIAVHSTQIIRREQGQVGTEGLSELQKKIIETISEEGKISRENLAAKYKLTPDQLQKEIAVLRHCELIYARKEDNRIYFFKK